MDTKELQADLQLLGYDAGPVDGAFGIRTRAAVQALQHDLGLTADGICGPVTTAALTKLLSKVQPLVAHEGTCRRMRVTAYYCVSEKDYPGTPCVPVYKRKDDGWYLLATVTPGFFAHLALEGTGICNDGRVLNVQGGTIPVNSAAYAPVLDYARRDGFSHVEYAGIRLDASQQNVVSAVTFFQLEPSEIGLGYGYEHLIAKNPWRTCAADPTIFNFGEKVFIAELAGAKLPDGSVHDGYLTINDTGSAIKGLHIDWFVGTISLYGAGPKQPEYPRLCHAVNMSLSKIALADTSGLIPS